MGYPVILGGDHAEFEAEWAVSGRPDHERPDWPLPSFDAQDWAKEFCRIANGFGFKDANGQPLDEGWMIGWFANALMRGFDERAAEVSRLRAALEKIERWFGEFPETGKKWDDGSPVSYGAAYGSNGERDFMRGVARNALGTDQ